MLRLRAINARFPHGENCPAPFNAISIVHLATLYDNRSRQITSLKIPIYK